MAVIHEPRGPRLDGRTLLFPVAMGIFFSLLIARLWYLQVAERRELMEKARGLRTVSVESLPPRGLIFDRNGRLLAGVQSMLVVTAVPRVVERQPGMMARLGKLLGVPEGRLRAALESGRWRAYFPTPIHVGASVEAATKIAESPDDWPGLAVESRPMRYYPDTWSFAHVLGYVWTPNERDVARLRAKGISPPPSFVGKAGLEAVFDPRLVGVPGAERYEVDARRRPLRLVARDNATAGSKLTLTLDGDLHKLAMQLLRGRKGAVVALDPSSGEVLVAASSPSFNVAPFTRGIREAEYGRLVRDESSPLINRAMEVSATYAPGSTFKVITTIAASRAGVLDTSRTVVCPGYYRLGTRRIACLGKHGPIAYTQAMAKSCNTYFADLALRTGPEALRQAALDAGLGAKTGISLFGEGTGVVPTTEWLKKWRPNGKWYPGDTVNLGIGQGEVSATPLQMANVAAMVANKGRIYRPILVRAFDSKEAKPQLLNEVALPAQSWEVLRSAMTEAIETGTGKVARIEGIKWAGKTGSAEKTGQARTHSWFIGFAPLDSPRIAIAVLGEGTGHGAEFAAPIAKAIVQSYLSRAASAELKVASASSARRGGPVLRSP